MKQKTHPQKGRLKAFTLTELLVVLVIIGILVLIALPNFQGVVTQAHTKEAQMQLRAVHQFQRSYFLGNTKYSGSLEEIGYIQEKLVTEGGNAKYVIRISDAGVSSFTAEAEAVVDFDQDGVFNLWQVDQDMQLTEVRPD